jgi:hypothetical protein
MQKKFDLDRGDLFHFSRSGPVQTGRPLPGRGGRMGVGVFARLQHTPGIRQWTRELRTGSRSVPQYGTRIRDWVPLSGDSYPEMGGVCDGPVCSPRVGCMSQLLSRAFTARPCPQERSPCPSALLPELRPNALLPEFIRSSASLRIRRRSSVWRIASIRPPKARAHSEPTASS